MDAGDQYTYRDENVTTYTTKFPAWVATCESYADKAGTLRDLFAAKLISQLEREFGPKAFKAARAHTLVFGRVCTPSKVDEHGAECDSFTASLLQGRIMPAFDLVVDCINEAHGVCQKS
jgi:hypothetical protein